MFLTITLAAWILNIIVLCGSWSNTGELHAPKYISNWTWMDTHANSTTNLFFEHGFNENPIKVEIQVRNNQSNALIFPGIKSANVIRGSKNVRAGVMCLYNRTHVRVMGPPQSSGMDSFLIHTRNNQGWTGDGHYGYYKAEVRVRVWHKEDFPTPEFNTTNTSLKSNHTFKTQHNVSSELIYATVQLLFDDGWIGEAQGSESIYLQEPGHTPHYGGVVFAVSKKNVYVWATHRKSNDVLFTYFGWGPCIHVKDCSYYNATVHISMWGNLTSQYNVCKGYGTHTGKRDTEHQIHDTTHHVNVTSDIIEAFAYVNPEKHEEVYSFVGSGAAMMDIQNKSSGLVYGYANDTKRVKIWHPQSYKVEVEASESFAGFIGDSVHVKVCVWGGKRHNKYPRTSQTTQTSTETSPVTTQQTTPGTTQPSTPSVRNIEAITTDHEPSTLDIIDEQTCTKLKSALLIYRTYLDLSHFNQNVLVDLSYLGNNYLLFTCKLGFLPYSGDFNRTFSVKNGSLSGQTPICKERNPLRTNIEIENRTRELVKNLTVAKNSTSKYRRSLQGAVDLRISSRVLGTVSGLMIGGFIFLIVMSDMVRFFRYICTR